MDKVNTDFKDMICASSTVINKVRYYIWRQKTKDEIAKSKQFLELKVSSAPMNKIFKKILKKLWQGEQKRWNV